MGIREAIQVSQTRDDSPKFILFEFSLRSTTGAIKIRHLQTSVGGSRRTGGTFTDDSLNVSSHNEYIFWKVKDIFTK